MSKSIRILEIIIVIACLGTLFTFSFGDLIAWDHMAGLLGVPFLFFLVVLSLILIFSKSKRRIRIIYTSYLITLISYAITILILQSKTDNIFDYLYSANAGDFSLAEKLLNWYCLSGMVICVIVLFKSNRKKRVVINNLPTI